MSMAREMRSDSTRNRRCPNTSGSRFCAPEPEMRATAGNGPRPSGRVRVPARWIPASAFG
jgi:hypothetical protein